MRLRNTSAGVALWRGAAIQPWAVAALLVAVGSVLLRPCPLSPAQTAGGPWADDFDRYSSGEWAEGSSHGGWEVAYNGYGSVGIETDGSNVHYQRPAMSRSPDETHASLTVSSRTFEGVDVTVRARTVRQLRQGSEPNEWEVAWLVWHYTDEGRFYYFIPKPTGWELGKVDDTRRDPAGPACTWPEYQNCRHDGAQRYLATGTSTRFPVGSWHTVRVRETGGTSTVWVNGRRVVRFTDTRTPYRSGRIGLYNEDAWVRFDDVRAVDTTR